MSVCRHARPGMPSWRTRSESGSAPNRKAPTVRPEHSQSTRRPGCRRRANRMEADGIVSLWSVTDLIRMAVPIDCCTPRPDSGPSAVRAAPQVSRRAVVLDAPSGSDPGAVHRPRAEPRRAAPSLSQPNLRRAGLARTGPATLHEMAPAAEIARNGIGRAGCATAPLH